MAYLVIVRFKDKKTAVFDSSSIPNFYPSHPDDFDPSTDYDVPWQESDGSFDGRYPARIVCMSASAKELQLKALKAGIKRMPSNFKSFTASTSKATHPKGGNGFHKTRKVLSKKTESQTIQSARRKRMLSTLSQIKKQPPCSSNLQNLDEEKTKLREQKNVKEDDTCKKKVEVEDNLSLVQKLSVEDSLPLVKKVQVEDDFPLVRSTSMKASELNETLSVSPEPSKRNPSPTFFDVDKVVNQMDFDSVTIHVKDSDSDSNKKESDYENSDESSNSEDSTSVFLGKFETLKEELKLKKKELNEIQMKHKEEVKELTEKYEKEIRITRFSCKFSEQGRLKLLAENEKLSSELQKLKVQGNASSSVHQENRNLKKLILATQDLLSKGMSKLTNPAGKMVSKQLDFGSPSPSSSKRSDSASPSWCDFGLNGKSTEEFVSPSDYEVTSKCSSPKSSSFDMPGTSGLDNTRKTQPGNKCDEKRSHQKSPSCSSSNAGKGLPKDAMQDIAERVKRDLKNESPLEADSSGKIQLGGGASVSQKQWNEYIRKQKKPSMFVKRLAQTVYGHEGLKCRTVGEKKVDTKKKVATPAKVDALVACYQGKLLADGIPFDITMASKAARKLISQKMQDEARPPKEKKKPEGDGDLDDADHD